MRHVELKSYCFDDRPQWATAIRDLMEVGDAGVTAAARVTADRWPGTDVLDRTSALAFDPCGEVQWVRDETLEWIRGLASGRIVGGALAGATHDGNRRPLALGAGLRQLWLLVDEGVDGGATRVFRYFRRNLQRLSAVDLGRPVLSLCGDGGEGVWLALGGDDANAELVHLDASGKRLDAILLPTLVKDARIAVTRSRVPTCVDDDPEVLLLDIEPIVACPDPPIAWRLWNGDRIVADLRKRDEGCHRDVPEFHPDLITIDNTRRVHLVEGKTGEAWVVGTTGATLAQHASVSPPGWLPLTAIAAYDEITIGGRRGVGTLRETSTSGAPVSGAIPTIITPPMMSPEGVDRGWMRADLDIDIEQGAAVEVSVAEVSDELETRLEKLRRTDRLRPSDLARRVDALLSWTRTELYRGDEMPARRPLRYPLHEIVATRICLRIRIHTAVDTTAPRIRSLRVLYPDLSYARYLPAVYFENPTAAVMLRRFLAVLESVFGDLETELSDLPRRIDPRTAPETWVPFLLGWLGLPPPTELDPATQRELLLRAPDLLLHRGTKAALEALLQIVVGADFTVVDQGEGPGPWALPPRDLPERGPRLGCGTLVLSAPQPGFRLACNALLGERALGYSTLDVTELFARRGGAIEIRVSVDATQRERIEPVVRRYLPYFIPAHCRARLRFVATRDLGRPRYLNDDLRVEADEPSRLGVTRAGTLRLHGQSTEGVVLNRSTLQDGLTLS